MSFAVRNDTLSISFSTDLPCYRENAVGTFMKVNRYWLNSRGLRTFSFSKSVYADAEII
jgi:hypothetical protein